MCFSQLFSYNGKVLSGESALGGAATGAAHRNVMTVMVQHTSSQKCDDNGAATNQLTEMCDDRGAGLVTACYKRISWGRV